MFCCCLCRWTWEGTCCFLQEGFDSHREIWDVGWWSSNPFIHLHRWVCGGCSSVRSSLPCLLHRIIFSTLFTTWWCFWRWCLHCLAFRGFSPVLVILQQIRIYIWARRVTRCCTRLKHSEVQMMEPLIGREHSGNTLECYAVCGEASDLFDLICAPLILFSLSLSKASFTKRTFLTGPGCEKPRHVCLDRFMKRVINICASYRMSYSGRALDLSEFFCDGSFVL